MEIVLSHYTALAFWCCAANPGVNARQLAPLLQHKAEPSSRIALRGFESPFLKNLLKRERASYNSKQRVSISSLERELLRDALYSPAQLHVLGTKNERRSKEARLEVHAWERATGAKELISVLPGLSVCSPELTFIQLSRYLSFEQLVYLGFELCGTFCICPQPGITLQSRPPLCSCESIRMTLDKTPYVGNSKKVLSALSCILEGAASPPEAQLAMFLTLPACKGGAGFKAPRPNGIVLDSAKDRAVSGKTWRACDLYWESERVAIEYDSEAFHSTREQRHSDAVRRNALVSSGIKVLSVTPDLLQDFNELARLELALERALGFRRRICVNDYLHKHRVLHREITIHCPQWRKSLFDVDDEKTSDDTDTSTLYEDECEGHIYGQGK